MHAGEATDGSGGGICPQGVTVTGRLRHVIVLLWLRLAVLMLVAVDLVRVWLPGFGEGLLLRWARRHRMELRELSGPAVKRLLRSIRLVATGIRVSFLTGSSAYLVAALGPGLSKSSLGSLVAALLLLLAVVVPATIAFSLCKPRNGDGELRTMMVGHYVGTWRMVTAVALGAFGLLTPVLAVTAGMSPAYRAQDLWWEGVLVVPLAAITALVLVLSIAPIVEPCHPPGHTGGGETYTGDVVRATALLVSIGASLWITGTTSEAMIGGLNGVALVGPIPGWAVYASALLKVLSIVQIGAGAVMVAGTLGLHRRLRPAPTSFEVPFRGEAPTS